MKKLVELNDIRDLFYDGMTLMSGGFMGCGAPEKIIDFLIGMSIKDISLVSTDTAVPEKGAGKLIVNGCVKKLTASHIGTNPETGRMMNEGLLDVTLIPQGTLAERIRAGGYGLGGILTHTGIGTVVEEGKQKISVDGREYLLELPLRADVAIIRGSVVDEAGNILYKGTTQNFNMVMAMAADKVVVEAESLVRIGGLGQEYVMTPGIVVDYIVVGGNV